jgi:hypothetical protein
VLDWITVVVLWKQWNISLKKYNGCGSFSWIFWDFSILFYLDGSMSIKNFCTYIPTYNMPVLIYYIPLTTLYWMSLSIPVWTCNPLLQMVWDHDKQRIPSQNDMVHYIHYHCMCSHCRGVWTIGMLHTDRCPRCRLEHRHCLCWQKEYSTPKKCSIFTLVPNCGQ